jgi:TonB family protein
MPPARTDKQRKVLVSFVVTPEGSVRDVKVVKRFKPDFDSAAV